MIAEIVPEIKGIRTWKRKNGTWAGRCGYCKNPLNFSAILSGDGSNALYFSGKVSSKFVCLSR